MHAPSKQTGSEVVVLDPRPGSGNLYTSTMTLQSLTNFVVLSGSTEDPSSPGRQLSTDVIDRVAEFKNSTTYVIVVENKLVPPVDRNFMLSFIIEGTRRQGDILLECARSIKASPFDFQFSPTLSLEDEVRNIRPGSDGVQVLLCSVVLTPPTIENQGEIEEYMKTVPDYSYLKKSAVINLRDRRRKKEMEDKTMYWVAYSQVDGSFIFDISHPRSRYFTLRTSGVKIPEEVARAVALYNNSRQRSWDGSDEIYGSGVMLATEKGERLPDVPEYTV